MTIREECDIRTTNARPPGGQHVGTDPLILEVVHRETGITIKLPPVTQRSQHKRLIAAFDAMEFLLASV